MTDTPKITPVDPKAPAEATTKPEIVAPAVQGTPAAAPAVEKSSEPGTEDRGHGEEPGRSRA
jgi:hypothetical protein